MYLKIFHNPLRRPDISYDAPRHLQRRGAATDAAEHVLLHCPALQIHRDSHHIHSLELLWERPEEVINFLRDASII